MSEAIDNDLLIRFKLSTSDEDFAAIVTQHTNLVYSVALRQTANPYWAEEITQAVFIILARKASSLPNKTILAGWLYNTARLTAMNFLRAELRRSRRDHEVFMQSALEDATPEASWQELSPILDEAMGQLNSLDRDVLVLRHFERRSLSEVAQALGIAERAAQKRVERALEKLRHIFNKRGVTATMAVIITEISTHSIQAAPFGLATKITATAIRGSAVAVKTQTLAKATIHVMTWLKTKTGMILAMGTLFTIGAGIAVTHHHRHRAELQEAKVLQDKRDAEAAGGPANLASSPDAQKHLDEQRALKAQSK